MPKAASLLPREALPPHSVPAADTSKSIRPEARSARSPEEVRNHSRGRPGLAGSMDAAIGSLIPDPGHVRVAHPGARDGDGDLANSAHHASLRHCWHRYSFRM